MTLEKPHVKHCSEAYSNKPPINYVIDGMIEEGTSTVFYGDGGAGKTYVALTMGICISAGLPFMDFSTTQHTVLYVDEEMGERMLERRIRYVCDGLGVKPEKMNLFYIAMPGYNFSQPGDVLEFKKVIQSVGAKFVIVDALSDVMTGDENSKKDVQIVFNNLKQIRIDGVNLFILHHSVKDNSNYRGSTAIKSNVDNLINFDSSSNTDAFTVKFDKTRDGKLEPISGIKIWDEGKFTIELRDRYNPTETFVLRLLEKKGEQTRKEIYAAGKKESISEGSLKNAISSLSNIGKIYRTNPDTNTRVEAIYALKRPLDYIQEICDNPPEVDK